MTLLALVLLAPLTASLVMIFVGRFLPRKGDWVSIGGMAVSWLTALSLFIPVYFMGAPLPDLSMKLVWFGSMNSMRLGFGADALTLAALAMVSTVSLLIHIYSSSYMHGNRLYSRFFAYISFFTFAMLGLVTSDNLLFLFIFWELMGLCSYLLIGFYSWCPGGHEDKEAPRKAAMKAFLTTRIGDSALFVAIAILYAATGNLTFEGIGEAIRVGAVNHHALMAAALLILLGAIGKSAQFPLHVWLPDAMEGPSPVSALIHAATMVAAGIYLVGRAVATGIFPETALYAVSGVGSFTAFFAASLALVCFDYKKVLAFSTISQLGFMLAALGVGAWTACFFHLITHAFFKALLFLGSGAVLHAVHTRDMRELGGLKAKMPVTYWTMMIGSLALAGFPGLAGFFSKDAILAGALDHGMAHGGAHYLPVALLIAAAGLTAFYTFRMMIMVFHGKPASEKRVAHAHEAPLSMSLPLVVLAAFAIGVGWSWFRTPFESLIGGEGAGHEVSHAAHHAAMVISIIVAGAGIAFSFIVYHYKKISPDAFVRPAPLQLLHTALTRMWWIDELYMAIVRGVVALARFLRLFDQKVVDALVDATAPFLKGISNFSGLVDMKIVDELVNRIAESTLWASGIRAIQTGKLQDYILGMMTAVLVIVVWMSL